MLIVLALAAALNLPRPEHVVVVIEENHTLAQVIAKPGAAMYLQQVAHQGALFTNAHGVTHPSLPNYIALFAGLTNSNGDACPPRGIDSNAPNLASELARAHLSFAGYSEGLPAAGSTVCWAGPYARKHAPWVDFTNVPAQDNLPLTLFPSFDRLPSVSFVVPNVDNDMHDGTVQQADAWAREHIAPLLAWARTHSTLVVFTWDEGYDEANSIPVIFAGPMVRPGTYQQRIDHYTVLHTIEAMYGLPPTGRAAQAGVIRSCWR
ncbi:MAG: alkaline phosphatase family protein [Candidatus Baltobacteraceae bacterium]